MVIFDKANLIQIGIKKRWKKYFALSYVGMKNKKSLAKYKIFIKVDFPSVHKIWGKNSWKPTEGKYKLS